MRYKLFDGHTDTVSKMFATNQEFWENDCQTDYNRMLKYEEYIQVFATFVDKEIISENPKTYTEKLISKYKEETDKCNLSRIEFKEDIGKNPYSSILAIEGGEALVGNIEYLGRFYSQGVRIMNITWNHDNELCGGIGGVSGNGLTDFGKYVIREMNSIGITADVSHISEKGFWDLVEICKSPFIASHSNAKALCGHKRNLSDEQIKAIIRTNGVIGVNFYPLFLNGEEKCGVEKILENIEYILNLGGENNVGIGSDFDGVDYLPQGINGIESMETLIGMMEKRGYGAKLINKILSENFMRIMKENLPEKNDIKIEKMS